MNPEDRLSTSLMLAAVAVLIAALVTAVCIAHLM
jgi:Gpi18-like mannosyltransferase